MASGGHQKRERREVGGAATLLSMLLFFLSRGGFFLLFRDGQGRRHLFFPRRLVVFPRCLFRFRGEGTLVGQE